MINSLSVTVGLLAALVIACGGVADSPQDIFAPSVELAPIEREVAPAPVRQESETTPNHLEDTTTVPPATLVHQPSVDDDRVEGLVTEWETELAPIGRVSECVERALGLDRPLRPEDFELQANQPAIVSCVNAEVSNE